MKQRDFFLTAISIGAIGIANSTLAFGRDDQWSSGYGQGVCEAVVTSGAGNQIYVACECGSGRPSAIYFTLAGRAPAGDKLFLSFDNGPATPVGLWSGAIPSDCHACASTFDFVKDGLKRHSTVRVMYQNGDAATFTLKGSTKAIGECVADFWK
ncbi:hypothetical protein [Oceanicola sp. 22II-s10i]|uniref:hypothetical protein n=1 Tax=Oceanicola sp. 22II-s10i TaxID=1317116 RepID=UPI0011327AF6|nr:hypothetical protein [Oceanicola sp. 22II-s10i]